MLAGGDDPLYRGLLASNFAPVCRLEVWRLGARVDPYGAGGLPVVTASVSATLASQTTRQLTFAVSEEFFPQEPTDLLAPYGNEIRAFAGVRGFGGPDFMWPVFRGRVDTVTLDDAGLMQVACVDRAGDVGDAFFRLPRNSTVGQPILTTFADLVTEAVPDAQFGESSDMWEVCPKLTWENDRASALDELAKGAASFWYALADGQFVMRRIPWVHEGDVVLALSDGPGGVIQRWQVSRTRQGVANVVTVFGERSDGTAPVHATVSDTDPLSPTDVNGPFGVKGIMVQAQTATTSGQAYHVARTTLHRAKALQETWRTVQVPDASLELGDIATLTVTRRVGVGRQIRRVSTQVVAAFTLPIAGGDQMTVNWRTHEAS